MVTPPKRILVIGMTDNPGGIEALLLNVMEQFDPCELQFDFLVNTDEVAYENRLLTRGSRIFRVKARRDNRLQFYRDLNAIYKAHANEFAAVWENANSLANIDYLIYAKRYGVPCRIMHCHNSQNSEGFIRGVLHRVNLKRVRSVATHFWSVSDAASEWFFGPDFKALPNYRVVDNAVDVARFSFNSEARKCIREELEIPSDATVIGNVGRLHPQKNQAFLFDVVAKVEDLIGPVHVVLVGKGELERELRTHAEKLGLSNRVHFVGAVADAKPYYDVMDLFLFPSLYEGLSIALLEAQASCLPCVVSTGVLKDSIVSPNAVAVSLGADVEEWASEVTRMLKVGRVQQSELKDTRFDMTRFTNLFEGIL